MLDDGQACGESSGIRRGLSSHGEFRPERIGSLAEKSGAVVGLHGCAVAA